MFRFCEKTRSQFRVELVLLHGPEGPEAHGLRVVAAMKKGRLLEEMRAIDLEVDREMAEYRRGGRRNKKSV